MINIEKLIRKNVLELTPYSSAREEYTGNDAIFLDANENPYNTNYNRYPDPYQKELKKRIAELKNIPTQNIFLGNGSDEAIDLIIRGFCEPRIDNILTTPPTYGMYQVAAGINDIEIKNAILTPNFQLNVEKILSVADNHSKILFVCSPNNPTANCMKKSDIIRLLTNFRGIIVVDEAYIDFSDKESVRNLIADYNNLVVVQTLSKAWGLAGIRLGMLFADTEIVGVLNKIKPPYNVNRLTQETAIKHLANTSQRDEWIRRIVVERERLREALHRQHYVKQIYPSDANFLLVKVDNPRQLYEYLLGKHIVVRDRSKMPLCEGCLRFTIGTETENAKLTEALEQFDRNK